MENRDPKSLPTGGWTRKSEKSQGEIAGVRWWKAKKKKVPKIIPA